MKGIYFAGLSLLILMISFNTVAQYSDFICGTEYEEQLTKNSLNAKILPNNDGQFLTAKGTLRILIIFAEFDNRSEPGGPDYWPDGGFPSFINSYIDETETQNSAHKINVTNYFDQVSGNNYKVIGDVVTVHVPSSHYLNRSSASQWILNHLDSSIDFSKYDNWTKTADYTHSNSPDGVVDMIGIIYRGFSVSSAYSGEASLGFDSILVDNDSTEIKGRFTLLENQTTKGSGVTVQAHSNSEYDMISLTHEISHWLLGWHPYYGNGPIVNRFPSLLQGSFFYVSSSNAYESERLGWITPQLVDASSGDLIDFELDDFLTTGDAIKIKVPNGGNEEFYFLENRQNISIYDNATQNSIDKGLFIHHLRGHYSNEEDFRMIPSFGKWNWTTDGTTTVSGNTVSIMKKSTPGQAGLSYNEPLPGVSSDEWMHAYKDESGTLFTGGIFRGNSVTTSFSYTNRPLFASNTNPSPTNWLGSGNDIAVKIFNENNGKVKIDVLINYDPYSISENTTWDGQIFLDNSLTVQSGAKLTIKPNTTVYVEDAKAINVYGELDASGVEFIPMNSTWNGITFHNGSNGEIENSTITGVHSYGGAAIKVYTDNHIEIHGNTITDITGAASGILFSSASDGYAYENHIENTSSYGIYAYNSSVRAFNNFIKGHSSAGVYSTGSSNVLFSAVTSPYYDGENTIVGGKYGLQIGSSSTLHAGNSSSFASQNRIANQSGSGWAHIYSTSYYTNYAQYNYFKPYNGGGGSAPSVSGWGPVTTTPYLATDPDPSVGFKRMVNQDEPIVFSSLDEEKLFDALELKLQSDFDGAANLFEELVKQSNSTHIVEQSLHELAWINIGSKDLNLLNRFFNLEQDLLGTQFEFDYQIEKARLHYANKELRLALDILESRIDIGVEIDPQKLKNATILAAHIATDLGDTEKAISFMEQATSYKTKSLDEFMLLELQNYIETKDGSASISESGFNELDTPTTLSLYNYPNPFNPTTNIIFAIPSDSHVELVVFDVLGRKVAELINEFRNQGTNTISFDASSLSSGIYLYQLTVGNQITTKQMTLIK